MTGLNKRGQAENWFAVVVFLFVFGVTGIIGYYFMDSYINGLTAAGVYDGALVTAGEGFLFAGKLYDKIIAGLLIVFVIGLALSNYLLAAGQSYYFFTFLMAAFYGLVSFIFNIVFIGIAGNSVFSSIIVFFPVTILICTNLHWVMLLLIVVGSVSLYAKRRQGQFE